MLSWMKQGQQVLGRAGTVKQEVQPAGMVEQREQRAGTAAVVVLDLGQAGTVPGPELDTAVEPGTEERAAAEPGQAHRRCMLAVVGVRSHQGHQWVVEEAIGEAEQVAGEVVLRHRWQSFARGPARPAQGLSMDRRPGAR
jgi:hypothetical protein